MGDLILYKRSRIFLLSFMGCCVIQFVVFKLCYSSASFCYDSWDYLYLAFWNNDGYSLRAPGYPIFLWLFSQLSNADNWLVAFQYFFLQLAGLYFLMTILFLFHPPKLYRWILSLFFLFNPLPFYLANYILPDAIFTALSLIWFSLVAKFAYRPKASYLYAVALLQVALLSLRYNALYYPPVAILAILFTSQSWKQKAIGTLISVSLVICFIVYTTEKEYRSTGIRQFSPFDGWQLANNALIMCEQTPNPLTEDVPPQLQALHAYVKGFMDTSAMVRDRRYNDVVDNYYLWDENAPLRMWSRNDWRLPEKYDFPHSFHLEAPLYRAYGTMLIGKAPALYFKYYIAPNFLLYLKPDLEKLSYSAYLSEGEGENIRGWATAYDQQLRHSYGLKFVQILDWYPYLSVIVNFCALIMCIGCFIYRHTICQLSRARYILWLMIFFWLLNMIFSVAAAPVVLRYQIFPISICFVFSILTFRLVYFSAKY